MDRAEPGAVPHLRNATDRQVRPAPGLPQGGPGLEIVLDAMTEPKKPNNARTALVLFALVVFFFAMVFVKRTWMM
jgi:hypothetical protein